MSDDVIVIKGNADFNRVGTFTIGGVLTRLDDIECKIRKAESRDSSIVLDLAEYITQDVDGKPTISVPASVVNTVEPTPATGTYFVDMFGTAGGVKYKLMPTLPVVVEQYVSAPDA